MSIAMTLPFGRIEVGLEPEGRAFVVDQAILRFKL